MNSALDNLLADLFPRPKQATLTAEVIEAVRLYNKPIHQTLVKEWIITKDKNAVDAEGRSLLHHAAVSGRTKLVSYFLKCGLQKDIEDNKGFTPLILAVQQIKSMTPTARKKVLESMEQLLTAGAKVVSEGLFPQVAVNYAAMQGDLEVLMLLESHGAVINDDIMGTPLWFAENTIKSEGHEAVIAYLQSKKCTESCLN